MSRSAEASRSSMTGGAVLLGSRSWLWRAAGGGGHGDDRQREQHRHVPVWSVSVGTVIDMRVAIDAVGRMVIPKPLREELGVSGATELEVQAADGRLEISVPDVPATVEQRDGLSVIVTDGAMPPLTVEDARRAVDRSRR